MLRCDKCNASISQGSKFCPQCGDPVTDADIITSPEQNDSVASVNITFGRSTSASFEQAVDICKNIPTYSVSGEGKTEKHEIVLPITEAELIANLYDLIGNWKSSRMLINGRPSSKKDLSYFGVGCYRSKQKAFQADQYCFGERETELNIWGCKRLNMPIFEWGGGWLSYGNFDNSGIWHFDKNKIKHELELGIKENELCPVLNRKRILDTLNNLPDTVNPKQDKNWEYHTSFEEINGQYQEVAIGIKPKLRSINKYVLGEYVPVWENSQWANENKENNQVSVRFNETTSIAPPNKEKPPIVPPNKETNNTEKKFPIAWIIVIIVLFFLLLPLFS